MRMIYVDRSLASILIFLAMCAAAIAQDESFESPVPILISANSFALADVAESWNGALPKSTAATFRPEQSIVVFVKNISLLPGEGANAFRLFAQDKSGNRFGFNVDSISPLPRQPNIYAVTFRIFDPNGYNGQPAKDSDLTLTLTWRGNVSNPVQLLLGKSVRQQNNVSATALRSQSTNAPTAGELNTFDRKRFMEQAAFGPTTTLDSRIRRLGFRTWINEQIALPYPNIPYPNYPITINACGGEYGTSPAIDDCIRNRYWAVSNEKWMVLEAFYGDDQLRRRVSWALHQIWVISHSNIALQRGIQEYIEILDRNAFGNYRDLMYEMTLSPAMGEYLDMVRSTRFSPNENYPRELLQLFTTGLYMLNQDGTLIRDGQGNPVPTYDQQKINEFSKVFTGWTGCNNGLLPSCSNAVAGSPNYIDPIYLNTPSNHDQTAKALFNYPGAPNPTIAACSNCTNDEARRTYAND